MASNKIVNVIQLIVGVAFILFFMASSVLFNLTRIEIGFVAVGLLFIYIIFIILIARWAVKAKRRVIIKEIIKPVTKTVRKTVIKEVLVKAKPKKKKEIVPMTKYIGSTQTKTYHVRSCRFSKLIKPKFAVKEDTRTFFNKNKYKACKMCNAGKK